jgi:hypothetical protein
LSGIARPGDEALKRSARVPIYKHTGPPSKRRTAMNLSPQQIQEHVAALANASVEETDDLLHDLFCLAWPTTDSQNN